MAKRRSRMRRLVFWVGAGLVAASVARELAKPEAERTWHGDLYGIPYDYRVPTVQKLRSTFWAPDDERLLLPRAFGIGWDVNVGRVVRLAREAVGR